MNDTSPIRILIRADEVCTRRWAEWLAGAGLLVWPNVAAMPPHGRPEVILTDAPSQADERPGGGGVEPGVVRVAAEGPADAHLPAEAIGRELVLACQLVGRIVRLRGQVRVGQEIHDQLFRAALSDPVTGLPNRRAWDEWSPARLLASTGTAFRLCLAVVDLDGFKQVNDDCGHAVGDEVLRAAAKALRDGLRHDDLLARLGGDEFGLLVQAPTPAAAMAIVDRVRRGISAQPVAGLDRPVTASAGFHLVTDAPDVEPCPEALLAAADAALREAKRRGRNCTVGS